MDGLFGVSALQHGNFAHLAAIDFCTYLDISFFESI